MRILLAEDDAQLRASIARGLREAEYLVETAATGSEALGLATSSPFDAIVLDILLPEASGIDVCHALRERGESVPILMLTALDSVDQRITGLDAGADDYLTKPFDFGELLARIRALTRRHADSATAITVGDLTIDARQHVVTRGERTVQLTGKEFAFLLLLARNAGAVVSRADLMSHVWSDARGSYSNIIDVYASRIRRKVDDGETVALFNTIRGIGFVLKAPSSAAPARATPKVARRRG